MPVDPQVQALLDEMVAAGAQPYEELTVANRVLGGTMGRLFRHLREGKGYTYGIGSGFSATGFRGDWSASTSVGGPW